MFLKGFVKEYKLEVNSFTYLVKAAAGRFDGFKDGSPEQTREEMSRLVRNQARDSHREIHSF